jgi:hypothetical protein
MAKDTVAHLEELEEDSSVQVIGILACAGILLASVAARCIMFIRRGGWRSPQSQVLLPQDVVDRAPVVPFQTGAVDAYTRRRRHSTSLSPSGFRTPGNTPMSPIQSTGNSPQKNLPVLGEILVLFFVSKAPLLMLLAFFFFFFFLRRLVHHACGRVGHPYSSSATPVG